MGLVESVWLTHYCCYCGAFQSRVLTQRSCCWAPCKAEYLYITIVVGCPFKNRVTYLHIAVPLGGPFEGRLLNYDVVRKISYERILKWPTLKTTGVDVEEKGCQDGSLRDAILEASQPAPSAVSGGNGEAAIANQHHYSTGPCTCQVAIAVTCRPTLSVVQPGILFRTSIIWCTSACSFRLFPNNWRLVWRTSENLSKFVSEGAMASGLIPAAILQVILGSIIPGGWIGDESTESRSALQLFCILPHFCFCHQMNCWVVEQREQNGCLDLRCCAFPLDGRERWVEQMSRLHGTG